MSRVAKNPVLIPNGLKVTLDGQNFSVTNGKHTLSHVVHESVKITDNGSEGFTFSPASDVSWALSGTSRSLVANMVTGIHKGFTKELELVGVGYRVKQEGKNLVFTLGYSHPVIFPLPDLVEATIDKQTKLTIKSIDKQLLGQVAANIHKLRKPDAYKGKGVRMVGVQLKLKEVKKK